MTSSPTDFKTLDRHECRSCGYVYEPTLGDAKSGIAPGFEFQDLPADWRCPVCGAKANAFINIGPKGKPSGFEENLKYGIGVNNLTPAQKSILIYSALGLAVLFFLSLYGLR